MTDANLRIAFRRIAPLVSSRDYATICHMLSDLSSVPFARVYAVCIEEDY